MFMYDFIFGCFSNIVQFYKNIYERLIFTTETVYFCRSSGTLFFFRFFRRGYKLYIFGLKMNPLKGNGILLPKLF